MDWSIFRPILLFGEFPQNMRSQYAVQYNFTFQQELAKTLVFQIGYVGSQGHRLLATTILMPAIAQTCLRLSHAINGVAAMYSAKISAYNLTVTGEFPHFIFLPERYLR